MKHDKTVKNGSGQHIDDMPQGSFELNSDYLKAQAKDALKLFTMPLWGVILSMMGKDIGSVRID